MNLDNATTIALQIFDLLRDSCDRIAIAGSIRRHQPAVHDIDIVYIPRMIRTRVGLWDYADQPLTARRVSTLVKNGILHWRPPVARGERYCKLHHPAGIQVDLWRAEPRNWGLILVLRTGPKLYSRLLAQTIGGAMPSDMTMRAGYLWHRTTQLSTPTESAFFHALNVPWWSPPARSHDRLKQYLSQRPYSRYRTK